MAKEKHLVIMELVRRLAEGDTLSTKAIEKGNGGLPNDTSLLATLLGLETDVPGGHPSW